MQGKFIPAKGHPDETCERPQAWSDTVDKFVSKRVERDHDAEDVSTPTSDRVYAEWCRENGE